MAELRLRVRPAEAAVHQRRGDDQGRRDHRGEDQHRRLKAGHREQQPAEEETDPLERVLGSGQDRDPAVERRLRALRPGRHDQLDGALGAHLGQVLGDPRERLCRHHERHHQPGRRRQAEHRQGDDLHPEAHEQGRLQPEPRGQPAADEVRDDPEGLVEQEQGRDLEGRVAEVVEVEEDEDPAGAVGQRVGPVRAGDEHVVAEVASPRCARRNHGTERITLTNIISIDICRSMNFDQRTRTRP